MIGSAAHYELEKTGRKSTTPRVGGVLLANQKEAAIQQSWIARGEEEESCHRSESRGVLDLKMGGVDSALSVCERVCSNRGASRFYLAANCTYVLERILYCVCIIFSHWSRVSVWLPSHGQ
ncbi:hypothetical protein TNCV_1252141 [Trichonephila clavipes]|nr:hypothetical protein TNCV_1252141 [Trichonephila clavipes]